MGNERIYNFSAGPSMLPEEALRRAAEEMLNYGGSGMSVMEMSHRSKVFRGSLMKPRPTQALLRCRTTTNPYSPWAGLSAVFHGPLNLMGEGALRTMPSPAILPTPPQEAAKYGTMRLPPPSPTGNPIYPQQAELKLSPDASYFYNCANNTIFSARMELCVRSGLSPVCEVPPTFSPARGRVPLTASSLPGAQKNMAPAGLTVVSSTDPWPAVNCPIRRDVTNQRMIDKDSHVQHAALLQHLYAGLLLGLDH
jgi:phosphoserine aminotransferase